MKYYVDYGETQGSYCNPETLERRTYTNKRKAIHFCAEMVNALGRRAWAMVWTDQSQYGECVAVWRDGKRTAGA